MALQQNHYRGHDSTPSPEYLADLRARTSGALEKTAPSAGLAKAVAVFEALAEALGLPDDPLAKADLSPSERLNAALDRLAAFSADPLAKADIRDRHTGLLSQMASIRADIELLERQAAGEARDILMRGRPEKMSESEWIARRTS
jgi:hypothetical protein